MEGGYRLATHLVGLPDIAHGDQHLRIVSVDADLGFDDALCRWRRQGHVAHLGLASVNVCARFLRLTLNGHAIFKGLQNPAWTTHNFLPLFQPTGDLNIRFACDTGRNFEKLHLVSLDDVHTLLCFWLLTARRW